MTMVDSVVLLITNLDLRIAIVLYHQVVSFAANLKD